MIFGCYVSFSTSHLKIKKIFLTSRIFETTLILLTAGHFASTEGLVKDTPHSNTRLPLLRAKGIVIVSLVIQF